MNEEAKEVKRTWQERRLSAGRWLRALAAVLDDLIAVSLAEFIGGTAQHRLVLSRIRREKK